jgi:hypothetical protein
VLLDSSLVFFNVSPRVFSPLDVEVLANLLLMAKFNSIIFFWGSSIHHRRACIAFGKTKRLAV